MSFFWLVAGEVTGCCFRHPNHQSSGSASLGPCACAQPEIIILHLVGALVPVEELRDMYWIFKYSPLGGTINRSLVSFIVLIINCLNLPFGTQGRSRRLKHFFLQTRNREPKRILLSVNHCSSLHMK